MPIDPGAPSAAVAEISKTAGLADYVLSGSLAGGVQGSFFRFSDFYSNGDPVTYVVTDTSYTEIRKGTYNSNTLTRGTLLFSTTGSSIDWPVTGQRMIQPIVSGIPLCPTSPTLHQVLAWDGTEWCPITLGTPPAIVPNFPLCVTPPLNGQVLVWSATENAYCPADFCALVAACLNPPVSDSVYFDGFAGSYYTSGLTGVSDDTRLSFSIWIQAVQSAEAHLPFLVTDFTGSNAGELAWRFGIGDLELFFITSTGFIEAIGVIIPADGAFHNLLLSVDTTNPSGAALFVDETDFSGQFAVVGTSGGVITAGSSGWGVPDFPAPPGRQIFVGARGRCCMGDVWWAPGQLLDFAVQANRGKFHDTSTLAPVTAASLGASGEAPTGSAPAVFLTGGTSTFGTNLGTGGALIATSTVEDCLEGLHTTLTPATTRGGVMLPGVALQYVMGPEAGVPDIDFDSATGLLSVWLRLSAIPTTYNILSGFYGNTTQIIDISLNTSGRLTCVFTDATLATTATYTQTSGGLLADGNWHHMIVGWDTNAGVVQIVIDRNFETVSRVGSTGFAVGLSDTWGGPGGFRIAWGAFSEGNVAGPTGSSLVGDVAEFWISLTHTLDLSVSSNLDKFELSGNTVSLGSNGSLPLGVKPWVYSSQQPQGYNSITFLINRANDAIVTSNQKQTWLGPNNACTYTPAASPYP